MNWKYWKEPSHVIRLVYGLKDWKTKKIDLRMARHRRSHYRNHYWQEGGVWRQAGGTRLSVGRSGETVGSGLPRENRAGCDQEHLTPHAVFLPVI